MRRSLLALTLTLILPAVITTVYAEVDMTSYAGQYCDTPSRCIDPIAVNGMVTSSNYLATQAGIDVLRKGGNAVDAAIAVASTMAVVYPQMNTIGGDNFWLIYNAKTGEVRALNASGRSGEKATIEHYRALGYDKIPTRGYLAANTVPGAVSGWGCRLSLRGYQHGAFVAMEGAAANRYWLCSERYAGNAKSQLLGSR